MIEIQNWKWRGLAGHFICANQCLFRLNTIVGKYQISSVGAMYIKDSTEMDTVGCDRHYETFVFEVDDSGVKISGCEIDSVGYFKPEKENPYDSDIKVEGNHFNMCMKYAKLQ